MKKLPFFIAVFLFSIPLYSNPLLEFGLMIAGNSTTLDGNFHNSQNIDKVSNKSFGMGAMFLLNFNERIGLQLEPTFIEKGGNNGKPADQYRAIHINYMEFPLLVKFNHRRIYLLGGGYQAIRLSAKRYYNLNDDLSIKNDLEKKDQGLIIGAGVNLPIKNTNRFVFELQYYKGLKNIIGYDDPSSDELKIDMLSFKIGLIF